LAEIAFECVRFSAASTRRDNSQADARRGDAQRPTASPSCTTTLT